MTTSNKIPKYGDPELLPKPTTRYPSAERNPFHGGKAGERGKVGPYYEDTFYLAPDLKDLPWERKRGNEWTLLEFRGVVFDWLIAFFEARDWPHTWDIKEVGSGLRSGRLPPSSQHWVIGITPKGGTRIELGVSFPEPDREPAQAKVIFDRDVSRNFDELFAKQ